MKRVIFFFIQVFAIVILISCQSGGQKADKIFYNAKIWTGDDSIPSASVVAIKGNEIIYVGDSYNGLKDDKTEMVDVGGKLLMPGLADNHTHFLSGGYNLLSVKLKDVKTKEGFIQTIKEYCARDTSDSWILGGDWDHESWGGALPERSWVDSVSGKHALFLSRYDGHMAFANSNALGKAGIEKNAVSPMGGTIMKTKEGELSGVFKDEAMNLINAAIPAPNEKDYAKYLETASNYALEHGVTLVNDMGSYGGWNDLNTYIKAKDDGKLKVRMYSFVPLNQWSKLDSFVKKNGRGDDMLKWGGLKGFVDGSLGSTTAWFYEPYLDEPTSRGLYITDTNLLRSMVVGADSVNLHVAVHAIGDKANDYILQIFEEAIQKNGMNKRRFRVEHAQHLTKNAIRNIARLQVIPSVHPYHLVDDGNWAYKRIDENRIQTSYAYGSLMKEGAKVSFGSDWPVAPMEPMLGIYAAVTRRTGDGKNPNGWYPQEKVSVTQALKAYTSANAYGSYLEGKVGKIRKGMFADMIILDRDILTIDPKEIKDVKVDLTIINGNVVYKR